MKQLFWLLALINIGLVAYFNLAHTLPSKPHAQSTEIAPEKIQVLSQKQIEALPKKSVVPPPQTPTAIAACFEWGIFSNANIANAQNVVARLALQATVKEQTSQQSKRFWVYRPPLKSAQKAQLRAAELKALGIEDLFVVQEKEWENAISFGIFEDEQLASKLLSELKAKGIKDAVKTLRNQGKGYATLQLNNLAEHDVAELKKFKSDFPEADLKEVSCQ